MKSFRHLLAAALLSLSNVALANFHTFQVEQLYSNASGTIQFVVLHEAAGFNGQQFFEGHDLTATGGGANRSFPFATNLPGNSTAGRRVLIATQGFAALGLITPDYIVPNGFLALANGSVNFGGVSQLDYATLPTDGTTALFRNSQTGPNVAANFNGVAASITAAAANPNYTALWWNSAESGWGINVDHQGNIVFATLFTYDAGGAPMWLVMSNGSMLANGTTFSGDLFRTTGPAFNANPFTPIGAANVTTVGTMTLSFSAANTAALTYMVNGTQVVKTIERQVFGSRAANCAPTTASRVASTNYTDLWWNPAESGWGVNVTHQDNTLFATLFTYDASGKGLWLVMSGGTKQPDNSYMGLLYQTTGPAFNANPFTPIGAANVTQVGSMRFSFSDGEHATLTYSVNGINVSKQIVRQVFSNPVPSCS